MSSHVAHCTLSGLAGICTGRVLTQGNMVQVYKLVPLGKRTEEYQLVGTFDEEPDGRQLTPLFQAKAQATGSQWWNL